MKDSEAEMLQVDHFDWGNDLLVNLFPLWKESILCDTTIICENDDKIQAHSILLAAASPSLYSFLRNSGQGTYEFNCAKVPCSVWRNVVTFIYTGRLDIPKEEMVPTYNLANKLAMFNFCKQLAVKLREHGLVRGGTAGNSVMAPGPGISSESIESETDDTQTEETDDHEKVEIEEQKNNEANLEGSAAFNPSSLSDTSPQDVLSMDLVSDEAFFASSDFDVDFNAVSETEGGAKLVSDHRYECPICFLNFKRHSALKKHRQVCIGKQTTKKVPPLKISTASASTAAIGSISMIPGPIKTDGEQQWKEREKKPKGKRRCFKNLYQKTDTGRYLCKQCDAPEKHTLSGMISHIKVKHMGLRYIRPPKQEMDKTPDVLSGEGEENHHVKASLPSHIQHYCIPVSHSYYRMKCKECSKLLRNRATFVMHVKMQHLASSQALSVGRMKTGDKVGNGQIPSLASSGSGKRFECHLCGRTFALKMHLGSHMRFHTAASINSLAHTKKAKVSKLYKKLVLKK